MLTWRCGSDHDGDNGDDAERRCSRPHSAAAGHIEDPLALNLQGSAPSRSSSFYATNKRNCTIKILSAASSLLKTKGWTRFLIGSFFFLIIFYKIKNDKRRRYEVLKMQNKNYFRYSYKENRIYSNCNFLIATRAIIFVIDLNVRYVLSTLISKSLSPFAWLNVNEIPRSRRVQVSV